MSIQKHRLGLTIRPGGRPFLPHASQSGCRAGGGNVVVCVIKNILYIYIKIIYKRFLILYTYIIVVVVYWLSCV